MCRGRGYCHGPRSEIDGGPALVEGEQLKKGEDDGVQYGSWNSMLQFVGKLARNRVLSLDCRAINATQFISNINLISIRQLLSKGSSHSCQHVMDWSNLNHRRELEVVG